MPIYAEISIITITRKREDGSVRSFEFRLQERDAAGDNLPFDLEGPVTIEHGGRGDDLLKTIKPTQVNFRIKTQSALAGKLINAESRQFYLTIREIGTNYLHFEGYIQPDFHKYNIYNEVQTVQLKATGELAALDANNADNDLKRLADIFTQAETELELNRPVDYYMRTRYDGQAISDPIPQRIWMRELGKLGAEKGHRLAAIQQIAQEFNFQIFQRDGRLVVADVYEKFRNPEAVNLYFGGTTQTSVDVLVTLDETNVIRKVADDERRPTGQKSPRVGRVVMQRKYLSREPGEFPFQGTSVPVGDILDYSMTGVAISGDIPRLNAIEGRLSLAEFYDPGEPGPIKIDFTLQIAQFRFVSDIDNTVYYFDWELRGWVTDEKWAEVFYSFRGQPTQDGMNYPEISFQLPELELPEIPENERGTLEMSVQKKIIDSPEGLLTSELTMVLDRLDVKVLPNDRPEDLYYQWITDNGSGETRGFPIFESDYDAYLGDNQTMFLGADEFNLDTASGEWIDEDTDERIAFGDLTARRKAHLLLGSSDRIHLVIRDTTQVSLLSVISFEGKLYAPVTISEHLFQGYTEIWMKPAPFLNYDSQEGYTFTPEDLPVSASSGTSRGWVTNRIIDSMNSTLAAGAVARTVATIQPGLVETFLIDREDVLSSGDEIMIIDRFTLNRYTFTVVIQVGGLVTVEPETVLSPIPSGSFVYMDQEALAVGVLQSKYALRIFAKFNGVGVLTEDVSGVVSSLPVNMYVQVREGQIFGIPLPDREEPIYVQASRSGDYTGDDNQLFDTGLQNLPIQPVTVNAPAESALVISGIQLQSYFHVDPGKIQAEVERERTADGIGVLSADRSGTITTIALQNIDENIQLTNGQKLRIINKAGQNEEIVVSGNQNVTAPTHAVNIQSKALTHTYIAGYAWVREPSYKLTGRLTVEAGKVAANASAIGEVENDLTVETNARLQLEADLDSAQASLTATITKVNNNENDIDSLQSSQAGLILSVGNLEDAYDDLDDDFRDFLNNDFNGLVDDIGAQSVLYTQSNGNVAAINLVSGSTSTGISLSANYIKIQDWQFVESTGVIRSTRQINGNDAIRLNGVTGKAEFENVDVRGTLKTVVLETEMEVQGDIFLPSKSSPQITISSTNGIRIASDGTGVINAIRFVNSSSTVVGTLINSTALGMAMVGESGRNARVGTAGGGNVILDSSSNVTILSPGNTSITSQGATQIFSSGDIILSTLPGNGELRLRVNSSNGMNIDGLPTSNPGGSGNVWKDGTNLRIT